MEMWLVSNVKEWVMCQIWSCAPSVVDITTEVVWVSHYCLVFVLAGNARLVACVKCVDNSRMLPRLEKKVKRKIYILSFSFN